MFRRTCLGPSAAGTQSKCLWGDKRGDRRDQKRPVLKGSQCYTELLGMPVGSGEKVIETEE